MNSKEFLNKIIVFSKEQINYYENKIAEDEKYPSLQQCHKEELISTQEGLNHFLKIKQDLDRLEQLEKDSQVLMNQLFKLSAKLTKYKKALNILKEKFDIEVTKSFCPRIIITETNELENNDCVCNFLTEEEYELLKEVFDG